MFRKLFCGAILALLCAPLVSAREREVHDCGPKPEIIFWGPVSIFLELDLQATPEITDRLIDDFPGVAMLLASLSPGMWACEEEDGSLAVHMPDQKMNNQLHRDTAII